MNAAKQFFALFKFQGTLNPAIWFMPLVFGVQLFTFYIGSFSPTYHPGLSFLLFDQNLFFIVILAAMVLAPEKFQLGGANQTSGFGNEFILTRAIDRPLLYRAKATLLCLLLLIMPCLGILNSLQHPDLIVTEYSKPTQLQFLSHLSGGSLLSTGSPKVQPSLFSIPRGNVLVAEWHLWVFVIATLSLQVLTLILYPFRYARFIFWSLPFGLILFTFFDLLGFRHNAPTTIYEQAFLLFAEFRPLAWIITALLFVLGQLWCERRFTQLEQ